MTPVVARLDAGYPDKIVLESEFEHASDIKQLLARKWSVADKVWLMPLSWASCIQLRHTFGDDLIISDELTAWAWLQRTTVVEPSLALKDLVEIPKDFEKANGETVKAIELQEELKLFPHQTVGAAFMASHHGCGIFDETGTGKSAQAIAALRSAYRNGAEDIFPVCIVAPNSVKKTWKREWAAWWPGLEVHIVDGGPTQRRKILQSPGHVYILNYEQLHRHSRLARYGSTELKRCTSCGGLDERVTNTQCEVHDKELNQIAFQTVIADEIHRCTNPSKQTRALWSIADKAKRRYGLTGTPIQDNLNDFWYILRYICPEDFPAKTRFIDRYADTSYSEWGILQINGLRKETEDEFRDITRPLMRRMLKKIVLPFLPPIIREERYIPLTNPQKKAYRQMLKEAHVMLDKGKDVDVIAATTPLSVLSRLMQFASCYGEIVDVETSEIRERKAAAEAAGEDPDLVPLDQQLRLTTPSNKISAFMDDIEAGDFGDSSIVVFAESRQLIELLSAEMTKKKIAHGLITGAQTTDERQDSIDKFQSREIKYILVTIKAGGVGLTLTAADVNVFLQRTYSSTDMKQALSRSHRIGSEIHEKVTIVDYISEDTVEEKQIQVLKGKDVRIEEILKDRELLRKFLLED